MNWQQIVVIIWLSIAALVSILEDGKTIQRRATAEVIGTAILAAILYTGGFWN